MRWLGGIGVVVLAFVIYLLLNLRSSTTSSARGTAERTIDESPNPVATTGDTASAPRRTNTPLPPIASSPSERPTTTPAAPMPQSDAPPTVADPPPEPATNPIYETTNGGEQPSALRVRIRRGQQFLERGNYKGALEAVEDTIAEYPDFADAYKVAIPALCALGDPKAAQGYLPRLPLETDRTEMIKVCGDFGTKLTP